VYVGASARVVEREVTQLIESGISGIPDIKRITSSSQDERSNVNIEFELSRDIDSAANDVRDKVARIASALPDAADVPRVAKTEADANAMMWIGILSDTYDGLELTDYIVRNLEDRFSVLPGVASVIIGGSQKYAMRVWIDREALTARQLSVADIMDAIRSENLELPAGRIESEQREFTVKLNSRLQTPEEFGRIVVRKDSSALVRLQDIAKIELAQDTSRTAMFIDGQSVVGMGIVRQSKANTLEVANAVRAEVEKVKSGLPDGIEMRVSYDSSVFIDQSIYEVLHAMVIALVLVVAVIYLFFRSARSALIPALAIPVSIIATMIVLGALGFSINILTLLALVLAIGLVVDDAIVVLENIQRRVEGGEQPLLASARGARQITFAVIATTLVLVAVFVPLSFMQGNVGRLFAEFGVALAAAVVFSCFVALVLTPMMCSKILKPHPSRQHEESKHWFDWLHAKYSELVGITQRHYIAVLLGALVIGLCAIVLYLFIPQEVAPEEDRSVVFIPFSTPDGSSLEYTVNEAKKIAAIVEPFRESGQVKNFLYMVAPGFGGPGSVSNGFGIALLEQIQDRDMPQQAITNALFPQVFGLPGVQAFAVNPSSLGQRGFGAPLQIVIGAATYEEANAWAERLIEKARENPRLLNPDKDYKETKPEIEINIQRDKAADVGVSTETIAATLEALFGSRVVSTFIDRNESYDVVVQMEERQRLTPNDLSLVQVRSASTGALIPLSNLIQLEEYAGPKELKRVDRLPAVTVSASLAPGYALGDAMKDMQRIIAQELPSDARIAYDGAARVFAEGSGTLMVTFALAILIVFLVLAAQFESWIHPLIIMLTVPLAMTGGLLTIMLTGATLNVFSQIGLLLLVGLIAKNGILVVEFANQLRDEGQSVAEAALEAARMRFRPVLMTTIATMFSAVPLMISSGAGSESRSALAWVIFGGIGFATAVTLFVIPALYQLLAPYAKARGAVAQQLHSLEAST
jgi:multidrug efflux pump